MFRFSAIQAKLRISKPKDIYGQEADSTAEQVMCMPEPQVFRQQEEEELTQTRPLATQITPLVQRQVEEETLQTRKAPSKTPEITPEIESRIHSLRGGDQLLPKSARAFFEPRFGYDFNQIQGYSDSQPASTSCRLNAQAFTHGHDMFFSNRQILARNSFR